MKRSIKPATAAVRTGIESDTQFGAVVPPLYLSSNYTFAGLNQKREHDYTRTSNPTRDVLADTLAKLEGGAGAVVTSTGMSAILLCTQLLKPKDVLVAPHDCYGGSYRLFDVLGKRGLFDVRFIDQTADDAEERIRSLAPKLVWVETPSNPLLRITDIRRIAAAAKSVAALVAVDNTFLSPVLQQPIALGADIVVHSTTKYLNGHSDVVGGAVVAKTPELTTELKWWANCLGITGAPFDSYLTLRGIRTLNARIRIHCDNAAKLARLLDDHPAVARVYYPGLTNHPGHHIARETQQGFGGMLSFELVGGQEEVSTFLDHLRHFSLAESLGGVESLVAHPETMTHAAMDDRARAKAGIGSTLIRLSVGIEDVDDLALDLEEALARCGDASRSGPGPSQRSLCPARGGLR